MMFFQQVFSNLRTAFVLSALPLTLIGVLPTSAKAANLNFDQIYVFGDSLSDDGNLYNATENSYPLSPPYFQGRFSNGPVWVEQLAPLLGLKPDPTTNFAFGGATTGQDNAVVPDPRLPGLLAQVEGFTKSIPAADPNALYIVWGGANDYIFGGVTDPSGPVNNLTQAVTLLVNDGAKNVLVVNLPDLGKIPFAHNNSQVSSALTTLSELQNSGLAAAIDGLSKTLDPSIHITSLDVYSLFNQTIAKPTQFGLTDVTDACYPSLVPNSVPCSNPDQYLFWDEFHPTTKADALIAQAAYSTLSVPEPADVLGLLAFGAFGAVSVLKCKQKKPAQFKAEVLSK